jgi:hypothetical protein
MLCLATGFNFGHCCRRAPEDQGLPNAAPVPLAPLRVELGEARPVNADGLRARCGPGTGPGRAGWSGER